MMVRVVQWLGRVLVLVFILLLALSGAPSANSALLAPNSDEEIVYFDGDGVIRIYDPSPANSLLTINWASPSGGWGDMALGDVTGDGDIEIIAIRQDGDSGRLTIFDPVAQDSPENLVQMLDGIPWAILYDIELTNPPRLVVVGEFDTARVGQEILYSVGKQDGNDVFTILRSTGDGPPGRVWEEQRSWELEGRWTAIATGNMYVDDPIDEVGVVSFNRGELRVLRVEPDVVETFSHVNLEHRWTNVAFGQFVNIVTNGVVDGDELAVVRDADLPLASAWVFRYDGTRVVDQFAENFSPSPKVVFFANISGNNDEELVVLREVRPELGPRGRLIVRDGNANDAIAIGEPTLDGDNEYKGGDGGDVDGDGREEIVIIRNNRIRIYTQPESSAAFELIERFTNGRTVKLGNIDAAGLAQKSRLYASLASVGRVLLPGQVSGTTEITIEDITRGANLPFTLEIEGASEWATVSQSANGTPTTLSVRFDSEGIQPGVYSGRLLVEVQSSTVENNPLVIDLSLTVEPVIEAIPTKVDFVYVPCIEPLAAAERSAVLSSSGELPYAAQVEGNPSWVSVAPESGILPETVTVSVDPSLRPADIVFVDLLVTVDLPNEPGVINRVPISLVCPAYQLYVPTVAN